MTEAEDNINWTDSVTGEPIYAILDIDWQESGDDRNLMLKNGSVVMTDGYKTHEWKIYPDGTIELVSVFLTTGVHYVITGGNIYEGLYDYDTRKIAVVVAWDESTYDYDCAYKSPAELEPKGRVNVIFNPSISGGTGKKKLRLTNARCEYQLHNQGDNSYHPRNMIDGKPSTAWAAKLDLINDDFENGIIVGPMFDVGGSEAIAGVSLMNGYCKSSSSFNNNTRASWVTIYRYHPEFDGETAEDQMMGFINAADIIYDGPIADNMESQFFPVDANFDNSHPTRTVGLLFKKGHFHRGAKWNDLCISEIQVFGK